MNNRLRLFTLFLTLSLTFGAGTKFLSAQEQIVRIGIAALYGEGVSSAEVSMLTEMFRSELINSGQFEVMESGQMNKILEEQGFKQSACSSDPCLIKMGQIIGVDKMVGGHISKTAETYLLDIRLIDVKTEKICTSVSENYTGSVEGFADVLKNSANELAGVKTSADEFPWLWVGVGAAALGITAAILISSADDAGTANDQPKLPAAESIWPPSN